MCSTTDGAQTAIKAKGRRTHNNSVGCHYKVLLSIKNKMAAINSSLVALAGLLCLIALVKSDDGSETNLKFVPLDVDTAQHDGRRLGGGRSSWGYFTDDYSGRLCMTNIDGKPKLDDCEVGKIEQLWRFDSTIKGESIYEYTGHLQSKVDKGCVHIRGSIAKGQKLEVVKCDEGYREDRKQLWISEGDSIRPRVNERLCAYHRSEPPQRLDPIVLVPCRIAYSFDFGQLEDDYYLR